MNDAMVQETRAKIKSIIESDSVREYFITSSKVIKKAGSNLIKYQRFTEYEILQEKLLPKEALILMKNLWNKMQQNRNSIFYKKHIENKRTGPFRPSIGGGNIDSNDNKDRRDVAIAWTKY